MTKYLIAAALISSLAGTTYLVIRHNAQVEIIAKIEREKTDAINKARKASDRLRDLCNIDPSNCVPDDWFRD
jgi:hypothetical protein